MSFFDYSVSVDKSDEFGICENKTAKELPAYIDYDNKELWDAVVKSHGVVDFNFIAVDNNIPYYDEKGNEKKRCDAMLYTKQTVAFIELKNQDRNWLNEAIGQLKSTIEHFKNEEDITKFKYRKAYVCNKTHPNFNYQFKDCMQKFFRETGILLRPERVIKNIK